MVNYNASGQGLTGLDSHLRFKRFPFMLRFNSCFGAEGMRQFRFRRLSYSESAVVVLEGLESLIKEACKVVDREDISLLILIECADSQ